MQLEKTMDVIKPAADDGDYVLGSGNFEKF